MYLNGTGSRREFSLPPRVLFLGILGEFLYWVDARRFVMRGDKYTAGDPFVLTKLSYSPTSLQLFAKERQNCKFLDVS